MEGGSDDNDRPTAIREHTPHTQEDFDDLVECMYSFAINKTLIENELERRRNNNDER